MRCAAAASGTSIPSHVALESNLAAQGLDQALHDEQAQADAAVLRADRRVRLAERLEDRLLCVGGDTDAGVADDDLDRVVSLGDVQRHRAARRELEGVADQVGEDDAQLRRVGEERADAGVDPPVERDVIAALAQVARARLDLGDDVREVHGRQVERNVARSRGGSRRGSR